MTSRKCYRCLLFLIISLFFILVFLLKKKGENYYNYNTETDSERNKLDSHLNLEIKQHLLKALRYSRSQNVRAEILDALSLISNVLDIKNEEIKQQKFKEMENKLQDVCLENYLGRIDHPLYFKGQGEVKCKKRDFKDVLTFVVIVHDCLEIQRIIKGIRKNYNDSKILIGIDVDINCNIQDKNVNIEFAKISAEGNLHILEKVKTDYVLMAPNIYHFDNTSKIERLVQMVSYTDVEIAAGGVRLENGQYDNGCYQMAMKMYTLKLVSGYDMSFNSCLYCDYSPAPFVARTNFLIKQFSKLDKSSMTSGLNMFQLFAYLMINNHPQILVCPDVLFHVKPYDLALYDRKEWFPVVSWFSLNRIILSGGKIMNFSCAEAKMSCYKTKGLMVPLCCLKELSDSLKFMNQLLKKQNVTFEVLEGTLMGGLKFNNILFWELDADTNFRVQDIDRLEAKIDVLKSQGYSMDLTYECPHKRDHEKCRHDGWHGSIYYAFRTPNWRTEMYGVTYILSDFRGDLKEPTKINIDGEWYITYTNPVLYARNIYGGDVFQHVEHSYTLGLSDTSYASIFKGKFSKCPQPGFHGCLDNFSGEGSLQFQDIYL